MNKAKAEAKTGELGYVYILTNPSFREDWVKIGMDNGKPLWKIKLEREEH